MECRIESTSCRTGSFVAPLDTVRLAIVTQDFPPETGGIQTYVGRLAEHIHGLCEHLVVIAPDRPGAKAADSALPFAVERIRFHSSWLALPLCIRLRPILADHRATHVLYAQWFPAFAPVAKGTIRATLVHGRELLRHPLGSLGLGLAPRTLRRMDLVIPNSRATAALLPGCIDPSRILVVHPGVDLDKFRPPAPGAHDALRARLDVDSRAPVVTTLARLVERKGVDTLLGAMSILAKRHPGIRLLVGGNGPDRKRLEALSRDANLDGRVRFCGKIPDGDLPAFLSLGVFALLSRQTALDVEGFGMVLAEAQACGAPVVAARSGGMPEAVGDGCGTIVAPDAPEDAAEALSRYLSDPMAAADAGARGIEFARSLAWESRAREIFHALDSIERSRPDFR